MNFAEFRFWLYLLLGLAVIAAVRPLFKRSALHESGGFDRCALACLGLYLLACVNLLTFGIFVFVVLITYGGLAIFLKHQQSRFRHLWLAFLVTIQLIPLLYYKYSSFLVNDLLGFNVPELVGLLIPVGLSFYTFQKVGFVIDTVLTRAPLPRFLDFLNFASFFPQIVAGPIERKENLLPQMESFRFKWDATGIDHGVSWIVVGLFFKMVLADNLALHFDPTSQSNAFSIWLANLIFGLRIYYDFAGYSLVALGVARCLGVRLTLNFACPYCARSIQDFWRRWHITLSTWFRDYLYIPLGGNRVRFWGLTILLVFVVSGIWHGAGWNFIFWGGLHGLMLIGWRLGRALPTPAPLGWVLTLVGVFYAWLCFYETRTPVLLTKLQVISNPLNYSYRALMEAVRAVDSTAAFVLASFLLLVAISLAMEGLSILRKAEPYALHRRPWVLCLLVIMIVVLSPSEKNDFIYFAF